MIGLTPGANVRQAGADYTHVADGRVREALEFLAAHLAERIDLRRLARHVGLSPAHLSRLFKADGRGPPHAAQRRMRLRVARDLLSTTPLQVKEVAARVGYRYVGNFVRDFHKLYGLTPSAFPAESEDAHGGKTSRRG